jgi:sodium/pantothenate symporter
MNELPAATNYAPLGALFLFIAASVWLGTVAQKFVEKGNFLQGYFLGNRGLGVWALALTATVQSGGTFMGFPGFVFRYGWIGALFIAAYMVVPITGFGIVGKRIAHLSRLTGAITMPDLFRERFRSPVLGVVTSLIILLFMSIMLIAQFKAGAIVMKLALPWSLESGVNVAENAPVDWGFYLGLAVFSVTVIGYTLIGGFMAAVWTDLFQSVMMFLGVLILLALSLNAVGGLPAASQICFERIGPQHVYGPGYEKPAEFVNSFLTWGGAVSFFFLWPFSGFSSPASVVRIMAVKDTNTVRNSIPVLCLYNMCIYLPLIVICICARALLPNLPLSQSDEAIPRMTLLVTQNLPGGSMLAGLILAAPFGAVMSTVSCYLVVIASGVVRDIYLRFVHPQATYTEIRLLVNVVMICVGLLCVSALVYPPENLQRVVVASTTCTGSAFLVPLVMMCYWKRANAQGAMSAMLAGVFTVVALYIWGALESGNWSNFNPKKPWQMDPMIWGNVVAILIGPIVTWLTPPPDAALVRAFFYAQLKSEISPS